MLMNLDRRIQELLRESLLRDRRFLRKLTLLSNSMSGLISILERILTFLKESSELSMLMLSQENFILTWKDHSPSLLQCQMMLLTFKNR
jgi:hypothetical protein